MQKTEIGCLSLTQHGLTKLQSSTRQTASSREVVVSKSVLVPTLSEYVGMVGYPAGESWREPVTQSGRGAASWGVPCGAKHPQSDAEHMGGRKHTCAALPWCWAVGTQILELQPTSRDSPWDFWKDALCRPVISDPPGTLKSHTPCLLWVYAFWCPVTLVPLSPSEITLEHGIQFPICNTAVSVVGRVCNLVTKNSSTYFVSFY